ARKTRASSQSSPLATGVPRLSRRNSSPEISGSLGATVIRFCIAMSRFCRLLKTKYIAMFVSRKRLWTENQHAYPDRSERRTGQIENTAKPYAEHDACGTSGIGRRARALP